MGEKFAYLILFCSVCVHLLLMLSSQRKGRKYLTNENGGVQNWQGACS